MAITYEFGNHTDVGKIRSANEDYYGNWVNGSGHLFVVCDGMGGHVGGAIASRIAVESIQAYFTNNTGENPIIALEKALEYANSCIWKRREEQPELAGMGTTVVAVLIKDEKVYYAHVGDSRIYHYTKGKLRPLTKDHSLVQSLVDSGNITEEEAETHPNRNQIYKSLGISPTVEPTVCKAPVIPEKGDFILLCSDGLTGMVKDKAIETILAGKEKVQQKAFNLVELANKNGGPDNITAQLIAFDENKMPPAPKQNNIKFLTWAVIALGIAVAALVSFLVWKQYHHAHHKKNAAVLNDSGDKKNAGIAGQVGPPKDTIFNYSIRGGDNENEMALKFGKSWQELKNFDTNYTEPEPKVGNNLLVRVQAVIHRESAADSELIKKLATQYHVTMEQICKTNNIDFNQKKSTKTDAIIIPLSNNPNQ